MLTRIGAIGAWTTLAAAAVGMVLAASTGQWTVFAWQAIAAVWISLYLAQPIASRRP